MGLNATFNNISVLSWRPVLLMEETGVPGENYRYVASHCQTLSHNVLIQFSIVLHSCIKNVVVVPCNKRS